MSRLNDDFLETLAAQQKVMAEIALIHCPLPTRGWHFWHRHFWRWQFSKTYRDHLYDQCRSERLRLYAHIVGSTAPPSIMKGLL